MSDKPHLMVIPETHPAGVRYSQEMVDKTFQVWAYMAGRSPTKTRRLLDDPTWREAVGLVWDERIPDRTTIEYWSKQYNWIERFHDEIEETGGAIIYQAKAELLLGLGEAVGLLRDTVNAEVEQTKDRLKAAELLMSYGIGRDSGGGQEGAAKPRGGGDIDPTALAGMDTEALLELARGTSEKFRRRTG